jgi:hypothetical protein
MPIQDLGAIGEILGALAAFFSLAYLALQIRHSNVQAESEALRDGTQAWVAQHNKTFGSEEQVALMRKALNAYSDLSQDEKGRLWAILFGYIAPCDNLHNQHEVGRLRGDVFRSIEGAFVGLVTSPGARDCLMDYHSHTPLPDYLVAYVRGEAPIDGTTRPMSEMVDFMKLPDGN